MTDERAIPTGSWYGPSGVHPPRTFAGWIVTKFEWAGTFAPNVVGVTIREPGFGLTQR